MIISENKIRRDDYVIEWKWEDLLRIMKQDAERQLREAGVTIPEGGLTYLRHIDKSQIRQLEEGSPSYKVEKWNADMSISLPASDNSPLVLGKRLP